MSPQLHDSATTHAPLTTPDDLSTALASLPDEDVAVVIERVLDERRATGRTVGHEVPLRALLHLTFTGDSTARTVPPRNVYDTVLDAFRDQDVLALAQSAVLDVAMLTATGVVQALHARARNPRELASRLRQGGTLLGLLAPGARSCVYPAFQVDPVAGRVRPTVAAVNTALGALEDPWGVGSWWVSPHARRPGCRRHPRVSLAPPPARRPPGTPHTTVLPSGTALHRLHDRRYAADSFDLTAQPHVDDGGRFDSLDGSYGYTYLGQDPDAAIAEVPCCDLSWDRRPRVVPRAALTGRLLTTVSTTRDLPLLSLHGAHLSQVGATLALTEGEAFEYLTTRAWARALLTWLPEIAGFAYRCRHDEDRIAYALFDDPQAPTTAPSPRRSACGTRIGAGTHERGRGGRGLRRAAPPQRHDRLASGRGLTGETGRGARQRHLHPTARLRRRPHASP